MVENLIIIIKREINDLNAVRRGFEYDVSNMAHPAKHLEIFEKELDEIKKELIYVKMVLKFAEDNAI